jgi:hypothetical protein
VGDEDQCQILGLLDCNEIPLEGIAGLGVQRGERIIDEKKWPVGVTILA